MITKQQALFLLEGAFDVGDPVMVHGTSVESTIALLRDGILPSSFNPGYSEYPVDQGYLFFVPRKRSFHRHPLYDKIRIDLDGGILEDKVKYYAQHVQQRRFMIDALGYWPPDCSPDEFEPYGEYYLDDLKRLGVDTGKMAAYGLDNLYEDIQKRRGVCIGINEDIFELDIQDGDDDPGKEVMIELPGGLDIRYLHYIYPFGELEDQALREFIAGLPEES